MQALPIASLLFTAATLNAAPQEPTPPAELSRFQPLVGSFEGSGTAAMSIEGEPMQWTAKATGRRILGGHFIQLDETVQTPMGNLEFRSLYTWDRERNQPVVRSIGTLGMTGIGTHSTFEGGSLVSSQAGFAEGRLFAARNTLTMTAEGYSFVERELGEGGKAFDHVVGRMKRVDRTPEPNSAQASHSVAQPDEAMARLAPLVGDWKLTGSIDMMGMKMEIQADETIEWMFGGKALAGHIHGQPGNYEADWYVQYDPTTGLYHHLHASNMGEFSISEGQFAGGKLVFIESHMQMGTPATTRSVLEFGDQGLTRAWAHTMVGAADPVLSFQATYQRASDTSEAVEASAGGDHPEGGDLPPCCAKAEAAGRSCTHPCCVEAAAEGKVCTTCSH